MAQQRFKQLSLDKMSPEQRRIAERASAGPIKRVSPPLNIFLRDPNVADLAERLGDYTRFHSPIPFRLKELITLIVARNFTAQFPWAVHYSTIPKAGLNVHAIDQIAAGRQPEGLKSDEQVVYDFCTTLLAGKKPSDATFQAMVEQHGESGIAAVIGLMGYYCMNNMAHNLDPVSPVQVVEPLKPLR